MEVDPHNQIVTMFDDLLIKNVLDQQTIPDIISETSIFRFGNGQFACLILCLTMVDLVTTVTGMVGGLVLELANMSWLGSSQGCAAYYFISSWMLGLSNYLVVCLVCLLLVKRAPGVLARLQECKLLLLTLTVLSLLPATPELLIRSTIQV